MRALLEEMIDTLDLIAEFKAKQKSKIIRMMGIEGNYSETRNELKHRVNLYKVYYEFLNEKINKLKLEL